jgi:prepilin-type N-terminal cleavage/methylation domain-containing protein
MKRRHGFTLVELLVVITIIGILVSMLLPAVQAARETGRRSDCLNHLKQLTSACIQHESARGHYPSGGWAGWWSGDPNFGDGQKQPGGWTYNVLPYIENQPLHDLGVGASASSRPQYLSQAAQNPLAIFYCPTRRAALVYPVSSSANTGNSSPLAAAARTDYAANAGTNQNIFWSAPTSGDASFASAKGYQFPDMSAANGVIFTVSMVTHGDITDGTANTMMLSEKYLNPDHWTDGLDPADSRPIFAGFAADWERWANGGPVGDRRHLSDGVSFGSCHVDGLNICACDGSGHWTNYAIDTPTFVLLCCRNDGQSMQPTKLGW